MKQRCYTSAELRRLCFDDIVDIVLSLQVEMRRVMNEQIECSVCHTTDNIEDFPCALRASVAAAASDDVSDDVSDDEHTGMCANFVCLSCLEHNKYCCCQCNKIVCETHSRKCCNCDEIRRVCTECIDTDPVRFGRRETDSEWCLCGSSSHNVYRDWD